MSILIKMNTEEKKIEDILNRDNYVITSFSGISMLPLLDETKDLVKIEKVNGLLEVDDMALFKRDDKLVLHRIMSIKKDHYEICGDNQIEIEDVPFKAVIGKVVGYFKSGRYVSIEDQEYLNYLKALQRDLYKRGRYYRYKEVPKLYSDTLALIRSVINDEEYNLDVDYKALFDLAKKQSICAYVFPKINKDLCPKKTYADWEDLYNLALQRKLLFDDERERIFKELDDKKVKHLSFKGAITNNLYPIKNIRQFADNDFLVSNIEKTSEVFLQREYQETKGEIENSYRKEFLNFEAHWQLFEDIYDYPYFKDYFSKAIKDSNNEYLYHMSNEDFYAYSICHFKKHYNNYGVGIRQYLDIYYIRKELKIDFEVADRIIEECGLKDFHDYILNMIHILFETNQDVPVSEICFIFSGNAYGSLDNNIRLKMKKKGKLAYVLERAFPKYADMSKIYPILKKLPILLPFTYILRAFRIIFIDKEKRHLKAEMHILFEHGEKSK